MGITEGEDEGLKSALTAAGRDFLNQLIIECILVNFTIISVVYYICVMQLNSGVVIKKKHWSNSAVKLCINVQCFTKTHE